MFNYGSLSRNSADEIILLIGMASLSTPQYVAMCGQLAIVSITSEIHKESCKTKRTGSLQFTAKLNNYVTIKHMHLGKVQGEIASGCGQTAHLPNGEQV